MRLDPGLVAPSPGAGENGVRDRGFPAAGPHLEDTFAGAASPFGPHRDGQVARALDGTRVDEGEVRPRVGSVGDAPEHPLRFARAGRRERRRGGE